MLDVNLVNTVFIGVLIVFIFIISMIALKNWDDFENAKEEISSLERVIEGKDIFKNHEISNFNQKISYLKEWNYRQEQEIKVLKNDKFLNEAMIEGIKKEREELKKRIEELRLNERNSESCDSPYNNDLFKCHCGSTEFIELSRNGFNGIKGVPPYVELVIQCVKCGGIHKIKDEPFQSQYHKKSTT